MAARRASRRSTPYGDAPAQVADLWLPSGEASRVAVLVHGGYWQAGYDRDLQEQLAVDLVAGGWAVWNADYRAVGDGGGWPATLADVAAAVDALGPAAREHGLPLDRVASAGHSAGGQLALWAAARDRLPQGAPGAAATGSPQVRPAAVVAQAAVADLVAAHRLGLGDGAVASLLGGGPQQVPERYAAADPSRLLPLGVPLLVVTGEDDDLVPPSMSQRLAAAARAAGDDAVLEVVPGEDHFAHLDPASRCWALTRAWLDAVLPPT
ncbi:S9 family peptidase [Quadrisphaera sp. DSM 44207]|uniref:alpha/beta hydrolase family protein n=1 Tax=Quadrisphaera sp. DSM 44207 TaxID=1881057 RepID=UPI00087F6BFA|nr:alpha/beta hydrolase [Quadrisphaera sp. DSM 44207]SDQ15021.1 Acetyl esterase/lipase [Quadrisphaera sp. DSM 44207]